MCKRAKKNEYNLIFMNFEVKKFIEKILKNKQNSDVWML
jgi:hypothetical protein